MNWLADRAVQGKYTVKFRSNRFAKTRLLPFLNDQLLAPAGLKLTRSVQPEIDFNQLLHGCRSALLREMPKVSGTMLSAGCSGRWYFDWIAERTGHVGRHIGIEGTSNYIPILRFERRLNSAIAVIGVRMTRF
jgi:hypothetical protein